MARDYLESIYKALDLLESANEAVYSSELGKLIEQLESLYWYLEDQNE